jgi:phosphoribosylglycinamide formyltransferase 1
LPPDVDARIAVLASGAGTNLQALLDDPSVGPWVALVVSDRPDSRALERARTRGIKAVVLKPAAGAAREEFDRRLVELLEGEAIEYVVLAGFMRILGPPFIRSFHERILNVHPALLPAFPGTHAVREALEWGVKVSGVTVHLVDEQVDHGPILLQEPVPILPDDDEQSLHRRIKQVEHRLLPAAVRILVEGNLEVEGRLVRVMAPSEHV